MATTTNQSNEPNDRATRETHTLLGAVYVLSCAVILLGTAALLGVVTDQNFFEGLVGSMVLWGPYLLLAPVVYWLANRWPLTEEGWRGHLCFHAATCLAFTGLCGLPEFAAMRGPMPGRMDGPGFGRRGGPVERWDGPPEFPGTGPGPRRPRFPDDTPPPEPPGRQHGGPRAGQGPPGKPPPDFETGRRRFWRAPVSIPVYWVVVGFAHILGNARRLRLRDERAARLEASLTRSRLETLQSQLQPHFLFNTLNAISALIPVDPRAADAMVADLADLLRITLARRTTTECRLDEELEVLDRYLAIMHMRFKDRLTIEREVEPACMDALVPAFLLQPLVENAIEHGVARSSHPGRVIVRAQRSAGWLRIEVQDNGPGVPTKESGKFREGIGLSNTRSRLQALHGNSQRMELRNLPDGGCCARIEIPFRTANPS